MLSTYLSYYVGGKPGRQGFASIDEAKAECLKGATFYRNNYLEIQIAKLTYTTCCKNTVTTTLYFTSMN